MNSIKTKHIIWAIVIIIPLSLIPIILKDPSDSWNTILSSSFTILGTLISIVTIIIGVLLYDKFGITAKFKEKQVWEVIELAMVLLKTRISAKSNKIKYFVNATQSSEIMRKNFPAYQLDSNKTLLFPSNYEKLIKEIYSFMNSHWLPKEIKDKMVIFDLLGFVDVENPEDHQYVKINFNDQGNDVWKCTVPQLTLEMLNINLNGLYVTIDTWLKKHSDIAPNFFTKDT